jgi:hypothetical protein
MDPSDPIGLALALVLAASALYRTIAGKRESLTAGLWTAAFVMAMGVATHTLRWSFSFIYLLVWVILLISFAALALAGVLGAYRTKQDLLVPAELPAR